MHDMHIIRLEIFSWVHFYTSRGHPRSSYGVKKGHLGSKIGNMAKCTWYAYHSIGNFLLNPMVCISRSSEVILRGQKRSFGVENRKYGQMHMICIPFDWKFSSEFNDLHLEVIRGHPRGQKRSFWGHKSESRPNTHDMHMIRFKILYWF